MNTILRSISVILLPVLIISVFSFSGCEGKTAVNETFYKYLDAQASTKLAQMQEDLAKYEADIAKKADHEAKIKALEPAIVDASGFWEYDPQRKFVNLQDSKITAEAVTAMAAACKELKVSKDALNWCAVCEKTKADIVVTMDRLKKLQAEWKSFNSAWTVAQQTGGSYAVSGRGLGYESAVSNGQWYFYVSDNNTTPIDAGAQGIERLLEKRPSYDQVKKATPAIDYKCIPPVNWDRRKVDYYVINQASMEFKEGSKEVTSLLNALPEVSKFWNQLSGIGYTLIYKGAWYISIDKVSGKKDVKVLIQVVP